MKKHKKITALLLAAMMTLCMIPGSAFADEGEETAAVEETVIETEETEEETALITEIEDTSAAEEYVSDETIAETDSVEETFSETIAETTEAVPESETELAETSDEAIETAEETVSEETETEETETIEEIAAEESEIAVKAMDDVASEDVVDSGTCGTNVTWTLTGDESAGYTLTISGNGNMKNYSSSTPWYSYRDNIKYVELLTGVTSIGNSAFYGCSSLRSITIPEGVASIGNYAFYNCSSLTSITIPEGVTSIGDYAFYYCSSLSSITIPEGVTSIGDYAFYYCSSLTSITIPEGVTSIGEYAFSGCNSLSDFHIQSIKAWLDFPLGNYGASTKHLYIDGQELTEVVIPEGITSIRPYAFKNCSNLISITIPEGVTKIGPSSFYGCSSLKSITIPDSVTSIGVNVFPKTCLIICSENSDIVTSGNYEGQYVTSTDNITGKAGRNIDYVFDPVSGRLTFSGSGVFYSDFSFSFAKYVEEIILKKGITALPPIGSGYSSLLKVTLPEGIKSIDSYAFTNCKSLTSINIPEGVTRIGGLAFYGCSNLTSITIPDSVTSIGSSVFKNCSSLTSINMPKSVTLISPYLFYGCSSLTSISIPDSVTEIGEYAFESCSSLTSITIPDSVTSIGEWAFFDCSSLTSITIPNSVSSIGDCAFYFCSNLSNFYLKSINTWLDIPDKIFLSSTIHLYINGTELKKVNVPEGRSIIKNDEFSGCSSLTSISIPGSVTRIESVAFSQCTKLQTCYIYGKNVKINDNAFDHCDNVTIYCPADSNIAAYAERIGIPCITDALPTASSITKITNSKSGCIVQWGKSNNASGYYIYRRTDNGSYSLAKTITSAATLKWTDTAAKTNGTKYSYYIVPYHNVSGTIYKGARSGVSVSYYVAQPAISSVAADTNKGLKVTWSKNAQASGYYIYRKTGSGSYSKVKTITTNATVTWTDTGAKTNGTGYTYYVVAYKTVDGTTYQSTKSATKTAYYLSQPAISSVAAVTNKGLKVTWTKNAKASGYYVYRRTGSGSYSKVKTITSNATVTWTDTGAKTNGTRYTYYVIAYKTVSGVNYQSAKSAVKAYYFLTYPAISSVKNTAKGKMTVVWNKNAKANGYQVKYVTGTTTKTVTVAGNTNVQRVISSLTKGKTYNVYVRSYKTVSGTNYYSDWSAVKSVKITR